MSFCRLERGKVRKMTLIYLLEAVAKIPRRQKIEDFEAQYSFATVSLDQKI